MPHYRKKPITIKAITFDEFVAYGLLNPDNPPNVQNGMPWSFKYKGFHATHENNDCYIIMTNNGYQTFKRGEMLITSPHGDVYPCDRDEFEAMYELV